MFESLFSDAAGNLRRDLIWLYSLLGAANLLGWVWALVAFRGSPTLFGTALLAYSFGIRHAMDADHIVAIDSVTRKLMQQGKRPIRGKLGRFVCRLQGQARRGRRTGPLSRCLILISINATQSQI